MRSVLRRLALTFTVVALAWGGDAATAQDAARPETPVDMVLMNGVVHTADLARPRAQAIGVRDGRIVFVGSSLEAQALIGGATEVVDLAGRTVLPGLIDSHGHVGDLGAFLRNVDLFGSRSAEDAVSRIVQRAGETPGGGWLIGRGWDQNEWADTRFPTQATITAAIPDRPVSLERVDGHALWVNQAAMDEARITRDTPDPEGGRLERDAQGNPTGVLIDNAMDLVLDVIPPLTDEELRQGVLLAQQELNRLGVTSAGDAGATQEQIAVFEQMARDDELTFRNFVMVLGADRPSLATWLERGPSGWIGDEQKLRVDAIKISIDGALGSRGAALLEDYADEAGNNGLLLLDPDTLRRIADQVAEAGFQFNVHAIGDRANRTVLDIFEETLTRHGLADHRWRIEHAQIVHRQDLPRFAQLGVIPAMQAVHQSSDMAWVPDRIGWSRSQGAYSWRTLLNSGVVIAGGSDFPVESADPRRSLHAAVTRQNDDNWPAGGWFPDERMTREEALLHMTLWPAYAAFADDVTGSITQGKWADLVVVGQDFMTMPAEEIPELPILMTIVGGEVVFTDPLAPAITTSR